MSKVSKPIEEFFLEALLKIGFIGISIVTVTDFYFTGFTNVRSLAIDLVILFAVVSSFFLYRAGFFRTAVVLIASLIIASMFYQSIAANSITTSSLAVIMVIGFGYTLLLKGQLRIGMHVLTVLCILIIIGWQAMHPQLYNKSNSSDIVVMGITYITLYIVLTYSSGKLKQRYDAIVKDLAANNFELIEKSNEIETQNEELMQSQENLYQLNTHLERLVDERTHEVKKQNELLIKYAYSNAHHVRGPVARVLGLIQLSKLESKLDYPFLFEKIEEQTKEIDEVVKSINKELET